MKKKLSFYFFLIGSLINPIHGTGSVGDSVWHLANKTCAHIETTISLLDLLDDPATLNGTYTLLSAISEKIATSESITDILEAQIDNLALTTSSLTSNIATLTTTVAEDFESTFTLLNEITTSLARIESKIDNDINQILTSQILLEKSLQTACTIESKIEALDLTPINFNNTFTLIEAITQQVCTTESKIDLLMKCSPIPITPPIEIFEPGSYRLTNDSNGFIVIQSDDVDLDLNDCTLTGSIASGSHNNIRIHDGTIIGTSTDPNVNEFGIFLGFCASVVIENITIQNCPLGILTFAQDSINIDSCTFINCGAGLQTFFLQTGIVSNCQVIDSSIIGLLELAGFNLIFCNCVSFFNCSVRSLSATGSSRAFGFKSDNGNKNLYYNCEVENIRTQVGIPPGELGGIGNDATGFLISGEETGTRLINCLVNGVSVAGDSDSNAYGIIFSEVVNDLNFNLWLSPLFNYEIQPAAIVHNLAWSSDGQFIVLGSTSNAQPNLQILEFTNYALFQLNTLSFPNNISSVAWSFGNQNLAVAPTTSPNMIDVYNYNAHVLTFSASRDNGARVNSVQWNPQNTLIAAVGKQNDQGFDIRLFEPNNDSALDSLETHGAPLYSVSWAADGTLLVVGGEEANGGEIVLFDTTVVIPGSQNALTNITISHGAPVLTVAFPPQKYLFAIGGFAGTLGVDMQIFRTVRKNGNLSVQSADNPFFTHGAPVHSITWSNSGNYIICGGETAPDGFEVRLFQLAANFGFIPIASFSHGATINSVAFSPSNESVVIAGEPSSIDGVAVRVLYTGLETPEECVIKDCIVSGVFGGTQGSGSLGISAQSSNNLVMNNLVDRCDRNYGMGSFNATRIDTVSEIIGSLQNVDAIKLVIP